LALGDDKQIEADTAIKEGSPRKSTICRTFFSKEELSTLKPPPGYHFKSRQKLTFSKISRVMLSYIGIGPHRKRP
jgi:hypothetical protein